MNANSNTTNAPGSPVADDNDIAAKRLRIEVLDSNNINEVNPEEEPEILDSNNINEVSPEEEPEIEERPRDLHEQDIPNLVVTEKTHFSTDIINTVKWNPKNDCSSLPGFLLAMEGKVAEVVQELLRTRLGIVKVILDVNLEYSKISGETLEPVIKAVLRTSAKAITRGDDVMEFAKEQCDVLWQRHQNFICNKSGLVVHAVYWGKLTTGRYNNLRGGSYVELPKYIQQKRAVVNVKNHDNRCFGYAVLACKYEMFAYKKAANEPHQYDKYFYAEGLDQLTYPVEVSQLAKVERKLRIPVNVFSFSDNKGESMYVVYLSEINRKEAINLLYWQGHYSWIKDFPRLMSGITKRQSRKYFCMQCLAHFTSVDVLNKHEQYCTAATCQQVVTMMPQGSVLKFQNVRYQQRSPFTVYADFECITEKIARGNSPSISDLQQADPLDNEPSNVYQTHKPCAVGFTIVSMIDTIPEQYECHFGEDCCEWFLQRMTEVEDACMAVLFNPKRLVMTEEDEARFQAATDCYVCNKSFYDDTSKVRDHDHITGKFRGAAHNRCNLLLRKQYKVNVVFHNFRGYDSHLIVTALGKKDKDRKLRVIGQGMEKYLTLSYGNHLVFKDSLQFMLESLERLVECLKGSDLQKFVKMRREFGDGSDGKLQILLRKGVYPYDYVDSMERFKETCLPKIEDFRSRLRQEDCDKNDYAHAQTVWSTFECRTLKDYHDLYLKTDVLLLADVFEAFRDVCISNYGLDPAHYVSAPHLSWDAMLKMTRCELELLSDPEMYRILETGLRGGVAMVSKRYAKANNKRMGENHYDQNKPESHIMYWDANNLYGWAMSQYLPMKGFCWMAKSEFEQIDWKNLKKRADTGYIVECDLDYPAELHDEHNDYPLAPERMRVGGKMLSTKQIALLAKYKQGEEERLRAEAEHMRTEGKQLSKRQLALLDKPKQGEIECEDIEGAYSTKLVPNLYNKTRYCVHYRNLKFYLRHGMVLRKVHRVLKFNQGDFMRKYIETNQNLRAAALTEFEKNFYKLMNNSCYGKTCENLRKRTDIHVLTSEVETQRLLALPQLLRFRVFNPRVAAAELMKTRCVINKPFYVGFSVLELSKLHMYSFHYDFVKKHWPGKKSQLLFTDTDSLMYEIEDSRLFEQVWEHRDRFDLSEYPENFNRDNTNKKMIGKFKDETNAVPVVEFVGLRPKMYSFTTVKEASVDLNEKHRAKGIQRAALKLIRHADYLRQLQDPKLHNIVNRRIGTHLHRLYTYEFSKRGLCAFDDKRYILEDGVHTLAYGHYRVNSTKQDRHSGRVLTSQHSTSARSFAEACAAHDVGNQVLDYDDDAEETCSAARKTVIMRPGLDPEQKLWQQRKMQLLAQFPDGEVADDFLDMLPFVV